MPETAPGALPADVVPYLYPSRYCEADKLVRLARHEFRTLQPGFSRVTAICNWIHDNVEYLRGSTNPHTSAYDTVTERAGVCRDFAHLAIAFCRAVAIPARFVAGYAYALEPPDFHAYFEAYLDGRWYIFDPTRLAPQTGLIRIGTGRDAADTSFATLFGAVAFSSMKVAMEPTDGNIPHYRYGRDLNGWPRMNKPIAHIKWTPNGILGEIREHKEREASDPQLLFFSMS